MTSCILFLHITSCLVRAWLKLHVFLKYNYMGKLHDGSESQYLWVIQPSEY